MMQDVQTTKLGSPYKAAKRERRRNEILDAAATVFARKGYFAATMQDIADLLGMRPASLYHYFGSKEAALEEVCRRGGRRFVEALALLLERDAAVEDLMADAIRHHLGARWRDYVANFAFNRQNLPERVLAEMNGIAREYASLWKELVERGKASGGLNPGVESSFAVGAILAVCNNAATVVDTDEESRETVAKRVLAMVLEGLRNREN